MGELIDGAVQHAPQAGRQFMRRDATAALLQKRPAAS